MTRVAIVGARSWPDVAERIRVRQAVVDLVRRIHAHDPHAVIVSGGAEGVDTWAAVAALAVGLEVVEHYPEPGKSPLERNTVIVADCDILRAFPNARSRGTWDTINKARAAGIPCRVIEGMPIRK